MMQITLDLPEDIAHYLAGKGENLSRAALEAIALEAYRERKLSTAQLHKLLGFRSRSELDGFLKQRQVWLDYAEEHGERGGDAPTHVEVPHASLLQENGLLVHLGKAPQGFHWDRLVDEQREERIREVSGL